MGRAFLVKIAMLGHLLDVVGHVRTQIIAAQGQFPDSQLVAADIVENQRLHVVDVANVVTFELGLDHLKKLTVHPFEQDDRR